ncbi:MAG: metallophosphoesterase [Clostridia bacterium]|nr:metallophosphoesterase [Clostridia bacterium]
MKKALIVILALLITVSTGIGGFVLFQSSKGISYDISNAEKIPNDIEIVSEDEDSVTLKKNSEGEFRVLMFTDTHLKGDKTLDNTTVSFMVKNITEQKPDLVILGGDIVTYGFNKKRNIELCELFEKLGVYWASVLGNHEGDGFMMLPRKDVVELYSSYEHCLLTAGRADVDGYGNCTLNILNSDGSLREVFFLFDSGGYMTEEGKLEYGITTEDDVYDGVKTSQVNWYKEKHDSIENEYGKFSSVTVMHIPPFEAEREYADGEFLYGEKREGVCESGFDAGIVDAMLEKGSASAVFFGHDHLNDFGVMYEDIVLSYIQPSGYGAYNMQSKFDAPENEWIQGCTLLKIAENGTFVTEKIYNHK